MYTGHNWTNGNSTSIYDEINLHNLCGARFVVKIGDFFMTIVIVIVIVMIKINLGGAWFIVEIRDLWSQESGLPAIKV